MHRARQQDLITLKVEIFRRYLSNEKCCEGQENESGNEKEERTAFRNSILIKRESLRDRVQSSTLVLYFCLDVGDVCARDTFSASHNCRWAKFFLPAYLTGILLRVMVVNVSKPHSPRFCQFSTPKGTIRPPSKRRVNLDRTPFIAFADRSGHDVSGWDSIVHANTDEQKYNRPIPPKI